MSNFGFGPAAKAWAGGFVAAIAASAGPFTFKAIEYWQGIDIPDPFEIAADGLIFALLGYFAVWLRTNTGPSL